MDLPERFSDLTDYAFPRLRKLLDSTPAGGEPIAMTIGEPRHAMPDWLGEVLAANLAGFSKYPANDGTPELLQAICGWLGRRHGVAAEPDNLMVLNGTREGLYNAAMALCPERKNGQRPAVLMPNPFYQAYVAAAKSVGAEPVFLPATEETGFLPDLDAIPADVLARTAIFYLCSPGNPQGAVASADYWRRLIALAEAHDFYVFADECYSEIWRGAAPAGSLAAAAAMGADPERVVLFNSLSKRSNLAGLRSGFVAGGKRAIAAIRKLRSYGGAPLPLPLQAVAARAWAEEAHVDESRAQYQAKYEIADRILGDLPGYRAPVAGMFLWLPVADDEAAALKLWRQTGVRVLPGGYLGREVGGVNPGRGFIRVALVAPGQEVQRGLTLLRDCLYG